MFGRIRAKRDKKRSDRERQALQDQVDLYKARDDKSGFRKEQRQADRQAQKQKEKDRVAREEGKAYADEVLNRKYEGLTQPQRTAMQESANAQINRDIQGYNRRLVSQQGHRGVAGGAAFAQQQDLARAGLDAQQQMQRDLTSLDADLALKKMAAAYNIEQGEVGQSLMRQQMAQDALGAYDQKKYQKWLSEQANKLFQRV